MEKLKQYKYFILIILALVILGCAFYWFQLRPTLIKKGCSWVTEIQAGEPAIPAHLEITQEEADRLNEESKKYVIENRIKNKCTSEEINGPRSLRNVLCNLAPREVVPTPATPAVPAGPDKKIIRKATKDEYGVCLRQNGL